MSAHAKSEHPPLKIPHIDTGTIEGAHNNPLVARQVYKALFDGGNEELALDLRRQLIDIEDMDDREKAAIIAFGAIEAISNQGLLDQIEEEAQSLSPEQFIESES